MFGAPGVIVGDSSFPLCCLQAFCTAISALEVVHRLQGPACSPLEHSSRVARESEAASGGLPPRFPSTRRAACASVVPQRLLSPFPFPLRCSSFGPAARPLPSGSRWAKRAGTSGRLSMGSTAFSAPVTPLTRTNVRVSSPTIMPGEPICSPRQCAVMFCCPRPAIATSCIPRDRRCCASASLRVASSGSTGRFTRGRSCLSPIACPWWTAQGAWQDLARQRELPVRGLCLWLSPR
jgi:hypothetical protein